MRIDFRGLGCVSSETADRNLAYSATLNLRPVSASRERLAIVGGGPSITQHTDELRAWNGEVWAINGAFQWCRAHGIDAAFVTIDPMPVQNHLFTLEGVTRAILSPECDPSLFKSLAKADIQLFPVRARGATTATAVPTVAVSAGYREVHFFGCESSYSTQTHAYQNWEHEEWLELATKHATFKTKAEFFMQAQWLAGIINAAPNVFKDRSGGLLRALIEDPEWDITALSPAIRLLRPDEQAAA